MNNREIHAALIDAGMHSADAYDLLADAGADPHPDAPIVEITAVIDETVQDPDASIVDIRTRAKRGGRPRIGRTIEITLPDDDVAFLDGKAREFGVSRAEAVRRLLWWWREKNL